MEGQPKGGTPLQWFDLVSRDLASIEGWTKVVSNKPQWREESSSIHPQGEEWNGMVCMRMCMCVSTLPVVYIYVCTPVPIIGYMHTNVNSY